MSSVPAPPNATRAANAVAESVQYQGRKASRQGSEQRRQAILDVAMRIIVRDGDADPNPPRPRVSAANKAKQAPNRRVEIWQLISGETGSPTSCRSESQRNGRVPFDTMR